MSDIVKRESKELSTTVEHKVANSDIQGLKVGAIYISQEGTEIRKITRLEIEKRQNWEKTRAKAKEIEADFRSDEAAVYDDALKIYYVEDKNWEATEWEERERWHWEDEWDKYRKNYVRLADGKSIQDYIEESKKVISGEKSLESYQDTSMNSGGAELIHLGSKEHLETMSKGLAEHQNKVQLIKNFVTRDLARQKAHLDKIKSELGLIVQDFENKIKKINRVIHTIELYLGIKEDIVQIQEGGNAPQAEPICFRQKVLFMDEEVGDPRTDGQGLDFREISAFDDWLCSHDNYKKVMPEVKGVMVFRVRREKKEYSDNPFINTMMNKENFKTYILIRNGDNLYRIWADINIGRLFPKKTELIDMQEEAMKAGSGYGEDSTYGKGKKQEAINKVEDTYLQYQKHIILLQGLIDRTQIFQPLEAAIKLTDPAIHDSGLVRFIYDDEIALGDGQEQWRDFLKRTNENIGIGSRVVVCKKQRKGDLDASKRYDQRYATWKDSDYSLPDTPNKGLYLVEKYKYEAEVRVQREDGSTGWEKMKLEDPCIRYNPKDEIWNSWDRWDSGHERKVRVTFRLRPEYDWDWLIDIDNISIEDIDYYLDSRLHRRHYLHMMPMLWEIRKQLEKEKEAEKDFVTMIAGILLNEHAKKKNLEQITEMVWEAVKWWKTKNKWKRALDQDNAKALRMIVNHLKKKV